MFVPNSPIPSAKSSTQSTQSTQFTHSPIRTGLLIGLGMIAALTLIGLVRYPGGNQLLPSTILFAGGAFGVLLVLVIWVAFRGTRPRTIEGHQALQIGSRTGALCGVLWLIEISFNNIVPPDISVPHRDLVDNIFWLIIVAITLLAAIIGSVRTKRFASGVTIGMWSGFISGMFACLAGLSLVVFRIDLLLRDPLAQAEYAVRGPTSGAPDMATYFARDTMAGGFGHLVLLGIIMGVLLGFFGGGIGRVILGLRPFVAR